MKDGGEGLKLSDYGRTKEKAILKIRAMCLYGGNSNEDQLDNGIDS